MYATRSNLKVENSTAPKSHEEMRVAHVVISDRAWGVVRVALELARQQSRSASVWIAMNRDLLATTALPDKVEPVALPLRMGLAWPGLWKQFAMTAEFFGAARELERANRKFEWDVVHFHLPNAYFISLLAGGMNKVFSVHGRLFENLLLRRFEKRLAKAAIDNSPTSVISQNAAEYLPNQPGIRVIPNGVDVRKVASLSEAFNMPEELVCGKDGEERRPLLVFPASMTRRKGQDLLIQSMKKIRATSPNARALLIGSGPDENFLKGLVREAEIEDSVLFLGYVDNAYPYMRSANVVLSHLSLRWPFPSLVELEALSLGKPVVTRFTPEKYSLYGDAPYYLRSEDANSLAEAVGLAAASDKSLESRRREAAARLNWENISAAYVDMYRTALLRTRPSDGSK